jgi:hypothetical protein
MLSQASADSNTIGMLVVAILVLAGLLIADVVAEIVHMRERPKDRH